MSRTTITIGSFGVPLIQAATRDEAWRASGYIHARDRAFQMDLARRRAAGRLAEWFGQSGLPHDRFQRVLGLTQVAGQVFEHLPAAQQQLLTAYTEGVNLRLSRRRFPSLAHRSLRAQMEPWREIDSLLVFIGLYQVLAFDLASRQSEFVLKSHLPPSIAAFLMSDADPAFVDGTRESCPLNDIRRFLVGLDPAAAKMIKFTDPSSLPGSNCWTIDGQRTRSGRHILACDLHLPPTVPNPLHRLDICVDTLRVTGVAVPGLPIMVAGSNGSLAWGVTNLPGDTLDLIASEECGGVRSVRHELIQVHDADDEELQINETASSGPLLPQPLAGREVALMWSGMWPTATDLGMAELAWTTDLEQAAEIARQAGGMPLNFHAVSGTGGMIQTVLGRIPQRLNGRLEPNCFVPPAEVGILRSGPEGVLLSANNHRRDHARRLPGGWNHAPGFRARRIGDLIRARSDWTEEGVFHVQQDLRCEMLDFYRDLAVEATDTALGAGDEIFRNEVRTALERWDGRVTGGSLGVPLLMSFRKNLRSTLLAPFFAVCLRAEPLFKFSWRSTEYVVRCLVATRDKMLLPGSPESDWSTRVATVLFDSARQLRHTHARPVSELRWKDVASRSLSHPLSRSIFRQHSQNLPLPADGDDDCIYVNTPTLTVAMRMVVSPGREEEAVFTMPGGQSESPVSTHYRDHHQVWCEQVASPLREPAPRTRKAHLPLSQPIGG